MSNSDTNWRESLTVEQYRVTREHGTEAPFSGQYNENKESGSYQCICCGAPLFDSDEKYDSGSGWPSFWQPAHRENIGEARDESNGMVRTEVHCKQCQAHLGHVFTDGPQPTGLRYCINSVSIDFVKREDS